MQTFCPQLKQTFYTKDNADAWISSSWVLANEGQRHEALIAAEQGQKLASVYRQKQNVEGEASQRLYLRALSALSRAQTDMGERSKALETDRESVEISRALAERNPDAFNPDLANSLHSLSSSLKDMGLREEALQVIREAVEMRRELVKQNPDAFNSDLADSLHSLSISLSNMGLREEALQVDREAVEVTRELVKQNPDAFNPSLANSLDSLSISLSDMGLREEALQVIRGSSGIEKGACQAEP